MNAFRFSLQKVLELRRKQLELAEAQYKQKLAEVSALDRLRAETEAAGIRAEIDLRQHAPVTGRDLSALDHFRLRVKHDEARIAARRVEAAKEAATRQEAMLEARRRSRLLDRMRERKFQEWESARDKELDEIASESYLAHWNRQASDLKLDS
jgi:flagellar export protein FliJ